MFPSAGSGVQWPNGSAKSLLRRRRGTDSGAHRAARLLNRTAVGRGDGFRASDRSRGRESYTAGHGLFGLPVVLAGADWLVELSASFARHSPAFSALP